MSLSPTRPADATSLSVLDAINAHSSYYISEADNIGSSQNLRASAAAAGGAASAGGGGGNATPSNLMSVHQRRIQFRVNAALRKAEQGVLLAIQEVAGMSTTDQIAAMIRDAHVPTATVALAISEAIGLSQQMQAAMRTAATASSTSTAPGSGSDGAVAAAHTPQRRGSDASDHGNGGESLLGDTHQQHQNQQVSASGQHPEKDKANLTFTSYMSDTTYGGAAGGAGADAFMDQIRTLARLPASPGSSVAHSPVPTSLSVGGVVSPQGSPPRFAPSAPAQQQQPQQQPPTGTSLQQQAQLFDAIQKMLSACIPVFRLLDGLPSAGNTSGSSGANASSTGSGSGGLHGAGASGALTPTISAISVSAPHGGSGAGGARVTASGHLPPFITPHPPAPLPLSPQLIGSGGATLGPTASTLGGSGNGASSPIHTGGGSANRFGVVNASTNNTSGHFAPSSTGGGDAAAAAASAAAGMSAPTISSLHNTLPSTMSMRLHGGMAATQSNSAMSNLYMRTRYDSNGNLRNGSGSDMALGGRTASLALGGQPQHPSMQQQQQQPHTHHGPQRGMLGATQSSVSMYSMMDMSVRSVSRAAVAHTTAVVDTYDTVGMRYVNDYMVLESVGAGAQGEVFCCLDTVTNEYRAIKVMPRPRPAAFASPGGTGAMAARALRESMETAQRLATEVKVLSRCRHPSVIQLFDFIDDPNRDEVYLVMQYVEHGALMRCDNDGRANRTFPVDAFLSYARQIISGLTYLHKRGIAHRDIRGENVLVGALDRVFIADFGVSDMWLAGTAGNDDDGDGTGSGADQQSGDNGLLDTTQAVLQALQKRIATVYGTGRRCGTTAFLAPELLNESASSLPSPRTNSNSPPPPAPLSQASSAGNFASDAAPQDSTVALQAADVWATGLLFYLMLYGELPFPCTNAADYIEKICNSPFELPRHTAVVGRTGEPELVPRSIRIILSRMLHRDPAFRANAADVRAAFKEVTRQREERDAQQQAQELRQQRLQQQQQQQLDAEAAAPPPGGDETTGDQAPGSPGSRRDSDKRRKGTIVPSQSSLGLGGGAEAADGD